MNLPGRTSLWAVAYVLIGATLSACLSAGETGTPTNEGANPPTTSGTNATQTATGSSATDGSPTTRPEEMNLTPQPLPTLIDEHGAPLPTPNEADLKRAELIQFLWGDDGFPANKLPSSVETFVTSPVSGLSNLERVDTLHIQMDAGVQSLAHHFIPLQSKRNRLVILHHGHSSTFDDNPSMSDAGYGMQRTINNLLLDGYSVMTIYMPGCLPGGSAGLNCSIPHEDIVQTPTTGSGMKFFVEPVAVCLNYLEQRSTDDGFGPYKDFSMVGLSGGGWTATLYAALDPRIKTSVTVAGSLPLGLRAGSSVGDLEQNYAPLYQIASYTDLYVLGGYGAERSQVAILNRHDNCCFGDTSSQFNEGNGLSYDDALHAYETDVRQKLVGLGSGSFRLEVDEAAVEHMISWNSVSMILNELGGRRPPKTADTFTRSTRGTLLHVLPSGTEDLGIPIVGIPAALHHDDDQYDVYFRSPHNRLTHAFNTGSAWTSEDMNSVVLTDPTATQTTATRTDVAILGLDYLPLHGASSGGALSWQKLQDTPKALGTPNLSSRNASQLEMLLRTWDHTRLRLVEDDLGVWSIKAPASTTTAPAGAPSP